MKVVKDEEADGNSVGGGSNIDLDQVSRSLAKQAIGVIVVYVTMDTLRQIVIHMVKTGIRFD